jgi:hypothetical protein
MPFQFTKHAVERYMQFFLMDDQADERDVRELLEREAAAAYKLPVETKRGDPQWRIDSLGCDMVTAHVDGVDVVVTIYPPTTMRGYTPEQAERISEYLKRQDQRNKDAAVERARLARAQAEATKKGAVDKERAQANQNNLRLSELNELRACLNLEREIMIDVMRSMRQKFLAHERLALEMKRKTASALRAVVSLLTSAEPSDLGDAISKVICAVDPNYMTDAFWRGDL